MCGVWHCLSQQLNKENSMRKVLLLTVAFLLPTLTFANSDLEELAKQGYTVIQQTKILTVVIIR